MRLRIDDVSVITYNYIHANDENMHKLYAFLESFFFAFTFFSMIDHYEFHRLNLKKKFSNRTSEPTLKKINSIKKEKFFFNFFPPSLAGNLSVPPIGKF